jgi:hypothetical protein
MNKDFWITAPASRRFAMTLFVLMRGTKWRSNPKKPDILMLFEYRFERSLISEYERKS